MMNSLLAKASIAAAAIMITLTPALADRNDRHHGNSYKVERGHKHYGNHYHGRRAHARKHFGHRHWMKRYYGYNYGYGYGHDHRRWR